MKILGIETSCDETGAAIVENGTKILSNFVSSSQEIHVKTGGIIPEVAAREQIKFLIPVVKDALKVCCHDSNRSSIDAIAATVGPGLIGSLLVGVETAKTLSYLFQKPLVPVNHLIAHLYANWLGTRRAANKNTENHELPEFPAVGLIVSGGHTDLVLIRDHGKVKWLGGTRDDAAGEAFDKIARLLGLPYPGGPAIAAKAAESGIMNHKSRVKLPRPLLDAESFDFSFSGLKTAVLRETNRLKATSQWGNRAISHLAYEVQEAITDVLVEKTLRAAEKYKVKSILLGGGVTANQRLREKFQSARKQFNKKTINLFIPPPPLSTDNAAAIASCAYFNYQPRLWDKIEANPGLYF